MLEGQPAVAPENLQREGRRELARDLGRRDLQVPNPSTKPHCMRCTCPLGSKTVWINVPRTSFGTVPRKHVHLACRDVAALAVHSFVHVFDSASACDHVAATRAVERVAA